MCRVYRYLGLWRIDIIKKRAHPELNQGPADLQSAALTTELYTHTTSSAITICSSVHFSITKHIDTQGFLLHLSPHQSRRHLETVSYSWTGTAL